MRKFYAITLLSFLAVFMAKATNHQVAVSSNTFTPSALTITAGDTVTWTNSGGNHNVNGTTTSYPTNPASFGNGSASSTLWTYQFVFSTVGSYSYKCDPHASFGMTGTVTVNAAPPVPCSDIFFSEYIEGGSNNKAIEIYNPTNATINLTGYTVSMFSNGATTATASLALYGTLASGDVFVYCADAANATILGKADTALSFPSPAHFNGNDAVILLNSSNDTIDAIGVVGVDPGSSGWTVGTGSTKDNTLVRKSTVDGGTMDWTVGATQYDVHPKDTTMFLGAHVSNCVAAPAMPCSDIFFSEYIEGGSSNKAIEIYNPTNASVSLSGYTVSMFSNGATSATASFALYGSLSSGDVFIFCADQANATILGKADTALSYPSPAHFNGNDAVILLNSNNDTIDAIGVVGVDPGSTGWTVGTGSTKDNTLVRKSTVDGGTMDWTVGATQYDVHPKDTTMFLGAHTSTCISGPIPPTIGFTSAGQSHLEDAGTKTVYMAINPVSSNAETVKVYVMEGAGITSGDYTLNPAAVMDTITFSVPANADTLMFDVTIIDDTIQEASETITFSLATVTSGLMIGTFPSHDFTIHDNDTPIPTYTINQINSLDMDYKLDSNGVECKIVATVLGVDMAGATNQPVQFTIHDGNGFGVYESDSVGYTVQEGDMIRIIGKLSQFNGLAQISGDSIVLISQNNPLPTPIVVTALGESTESELIRINNVTILDPTDWTNSGSGFNVDVSNGTDTFAMRIDNNVDLYNMPAPVGTFDVIGIGGQYDSSVPHNSGYQFLPRSSADIIQGAPLTYPLHISEIMAGSADPNANVNGDWFEITNTGMDSINLTGFSFDDESEVPGTQVFGNVIIKGGESIVVWRGAAADLADFKNTWRLNTANPQIITIDDLTGSGSFPNFSQSGDACVLYDTSAVVIEICNAAFSSSLAGRAVEFDNNCLLSGNATDGVNGAYYSNGGDQGSPGNVTPDIGIGENSLEGITMYPNPVSETLNINLPENGTKTISIVNMFGSEVINTSEKATRVELNVSTLSAGVYIVKVSSEGRIYSQTIVVE